ncbi:hypothetical protein GCM10023186_41370 [Hymenobacter koreensis]|uniref:Uncharacterized protein n=1 Tax=Hymenobacter koreensis TaxID=1084523 RepID=A0ABP8JJA0_9BACT
MSQVLTIRKGHKVFISTPTNFYGAKVLGVAKNHIRVVCYYDSQGPHNVSKDSVSLQDGQY